jgi:hypothetical protein
MTDILLATVGSISAWVPGHEALAVLVLIVDLVVLAVIAAALHWRRITA